MKIKSFLIFGLIIGVVSLFAFYPKNNADPIEKEAIILRSVLTLMDKVHFKPKDINDDFSKKIYKNFLTTLDGGKRSNIEGDGDPLDVCIMTERNIVHGNILIHAKPIGGFRMIDNNQADDKIVAIMLGDKVYGEWNDIFEMPESLRERLLHYFLTYKQIPGRNEKAKVEITHVYGREEAHEVIKRSIMDYKELIDLKKSF